jgi:hypothetical protein
MKQYRITKYDPQYRNDRGVFTKPDWTSISDIGKTIDGHSVTESEYMRVEDAYIESALHFLSEGGILSLTVRGLENHCKHPTTVSEGLTLTLHELQTPFREVLREKYWCRFEQNGKGFAHFGYDYYMYIGVSVLCSRSIQFATERGLFVEEFTSPHHGEKNAVR